MVDKVIGELPSISSLDDESLFVAEQNGQAVKVSGKQLTDFSNVETTAQVEQAKASAQAAKTAQDAAEAAILKGPIIKNGTWWVYNQTAGAYQDTGIEATGPQGIPGPTASVNGISPDGSGNITLTAGNVNAYSKSESDTLLQNNDPKKWGLGIVLANTPGVVITDFDDILPTGFYYVQSGSLNRPINGALYAVVINRSYNDVTVFAEDPDGVISRRKYNGSWGVWEYVNPLMLLGVEYRTTERHLGKPVYAKLFDCGALPNNAEKQYNFGISNINGIVGHYAMSNGRDPLPSHNTQVSPQQNIDVNLLTVYAGGRIRVQTNYDASGGNLYVKLKYTKTTD